ncbi:inversin isoform X2 [Venturia canescens]|uniref:inversin isoform X2 n=1 Tax=Venturia canescens TaxID=32260 RepID=UPI001C9D123C|nr:inversin isoform X2 [Venturia canescens]
MDARTPPIPSKNPERERESRRERGKSPEPVSLPPLTPFLPSKSNGYPHQRQYQSSRQLVPPGASCWTGGVPRVSRDRENRTTRPVLEIGATPLMHACQQGDRSRVVKLLKEQPETLGYRDRTLRSALHYCMDAGTGGALAVTAPELVNAPDAEGHTPLHLAVIAGDARLVAVLLANGANVNAKDSEGHGVLHWATVCGEAECVRLVLAAGARPSSPDFRGGSPLHYAAQCCGAACTTRLSVPTKLGLEILRTLLEFGADVNARDEDGRQPILWAASAGSVEAVLALARAGGSAAAGATDKDGLTALHCAASRGHARCVEALVNLCGCDPDHVDDNGCSALHYAATLGHADATALLLRLGADPNRRDRKGRTPALCAAAKGRLETLKILAQHGGSLQARTVRGTGLAHEAVLSGCTDLIEWLAKKRPSVLDLTTQDGKTPLHVAALHGSLDVCKVLLDHGARVNAVLRTSKNGPMTPLDAALYRGHRDCAKLIQMHGGTTARRLGTRNETSPIRGFAAQLSVKREDSSTEETSGGSGRRHQAFETYIISPDGERTVEQRRRREREAEAVGGEAGASRTTLENRRDSGSFSEEEITVGESSRRCCRRRRHHCCHRRRRRRPRRADLHEARADCDRRAKSESSRYEDKKKREYGESWSDANEYSSEEERKEKGEKERKAARSRVPGDGNTKSKDGRGELTDDGTDTEDESVSDDSLEVVVVVKKSLEKTSEKIQITGNKSKTPRETSKETRVREETRRSRRRRRSRGRGRGESVERIGAEAGPERGPTGERIVENENEEEDRKLGEDATDSTSPETVERVTVTALVHKDEAPDTPEEHEGRVATPATSVQADREEEETHRASGTEIEEAKNAETLERLESGSGAEEFASPGTPSPRIAQENVVEQAGNGAAQSTTETTTTTTTTTTTSTSTSSPSRSEKEKIEKIEEDESGSNGRSSPSNEASVLQVVKQHEEMPARLEANDSIVVAPEETETSNLDQAESAGVNGENLTDDREEIADNDIDERRESESAYESTDAKLPSTGSNSGKSSRSETRSRPSTGKKTSSGEAPTDGSAIVAVIESPEWDDEEIEKEIIQASTTGAEESAHGETDPDDSPRVFRVLRSPSENREEEERPGGLSSSRKSAGTIKSKDSMSQPLQTSAQRRVASRGQSGGSADSEVRGARGKQRRDSAGRDSGIEPSPRVSKIPTRTTKPRYCPNTDKQRALNMETITRDVQISLRRYHLERKIFFQLMELKRLQIRHGRANEHVLVKRQVESFHRAGMSGPALGVAKYDQALTFRDFEAFLYEQLRRLQRRPATPDFCTEAKQCTRKTHRCHHATSAYTSLPIYTYLGGGGGAQDREEALLPRIENRGRGRMTVKVTRGEEKRVIALPTEKLDRTKRYFVTFTVSRGERENGQTLSSSSSSSSVSLEGTTKPSRRSTQRNAKSV